MTYGEARDNSLYLIHQESIAGTVIPGTYNNQQDYLDKIPGLINAAQMDIATTVKPIPAEVMLGDLQKKVRHGTFIYTLPDDVWQRRGSGILIPSRGPFEPGPYPHRPGPGVHYSRYNQVRMINNNELLCPMELPPDSILEYFRYPRRLSVAPKDTDRLDNVPEAQEAVPYYVAAHLVMYDDAFLYATLFNEYTAKKDNMRDRPMTEPDIVQDVYLDYATDYHFWG